MKQATMPALPTDFLVCPTIRTWNVGNLEQAAFERKHSKYIQELEKDQEVYVKS